MGQCKTTSTQIPTAQKTTISRHFNIQADHKRSPKHKTAITNGKRLIFSFNARRQNKKTNTMRLLLSARENVSTQSNHRCGLLKFAKTLLGLLTKKQFLVLSAESLLKSIASVNSDYDTLYAGLVFRINVDG